MKKINMTRYLSSVTEECPNQNVTTSIQPNIPSPVCISCMKKRSTFINLTKCKHAYYMNYFIKPPELDDFRQLVCFECHSVLIMIQKFKEQIEYSFKAFSAGTGIAAPLHTVKPRALTFHKAVDILLGGNEMDSNIARSETVTTAGTTTIPGETTGCVGPALTPRSDSILVNAVIKAMTAIDQKSAINEPESTIHPDFERDDTASSMRNSDHLLETTISDAPPCPVSGATQSESEIQRDAESLMSDSSLDSILPSFLETRAKILKPSKLLTMVMLSNVEIQKEISKMKNSEKYKEFNYKCDNCVVGYGNKAKFLQHLIEKHCSYQKGSRVCKICTQVLSPETYYQHLYRHYTRYECNTCRKRFQCIEDAQQHTENYHGPIKKCRLCNFSTDTVIKLKHHCLKYHRKVTCRVCGKVCGDPKKLETHLSKTHNIINAKHKLMAMHDCEICKQSFCTKEQCEEHIKSHHETDSDPINPNFICHYCRINVKGVHMMELHLKTHMDDYNVYEK